MTHEGTQHPLRLRDLMCERRPGSRHPLVQNLLCCAVSPPHTMAFCVDYLISLLEDVRVRKSDPLLASLSASVSRWSVHTIDNTRSVPHRPQWLRPSCGLRAALRRPGPFLGTTSRFRRILLDRQPR